ncbi:MAG: hypothetical protein AAGK37_09345 [Pseudomonadota bacterium]
MRLLSFTTVGACLLLLNAALPLTAQTATEAGAPIAVDMPGSDGAVGSPIRINRGSGFAPLPVSTVKRGVVADASRPVVVSDEPSSRVGRPVSQHRWGVFQRSRIGSSDRYYVYSRPRYRHDTYYGRYKHELKKSKTSGPSSGRLHAQGGSVRGLGRGVSVRTGGSKLRLGF